jgi:hypothetical protein
VVKFSLDSNSKHGDQYQNKLNLRVLDSEALAGFITQKCRYFATKTVLLLFVKLFHAEISLNFVNIKQLFNFKIFYMWISFA